MKRKRRKKKGRKRQRKNKRKKKKKKKERQRAVTYGELELLLSLVLDGEGPPSLDPLVFEQRHLRHRPVRLQHVQRAQLGRLGASREPVQIQRQGTCTTNG